VGHVSSTGEIRNGLVRKLERNKETGLLGELCVNGRILKCEDVVL
jgi:hypothetical protein